jgi:Protein kinase domain
MDVKPSNVMVLATGEVRLIDFTGARYWREEEITQIAYTPESGGPEAFGGVKYVGPAYDVHGFGSVAYYLVTGAYPRVDGRGSGVPQGESSPAPWSVLRRHPMLERVPVLRDHLHAILADRPADRPDTRELAGWVTKLGELARRYGAADVGVDWREPEQSEAARVIGRARPAVTGTETDAYQRIERLERELVELRAMTATSPSGTRVAAPVAASAGNGAVANAVAARALTPAGAAAGAPSTGAGSNAPTAVSALGSGASAEGHGDPPQMRGRARVIPKPAPEPTGVVVDPVAADVRRYRPLPGERSAALKIGWELTGTGAFIAFICWGIWAASARGRLAGPLIAFALVLAVAAGVFALTRLLGRLLIEQRLGRPRRSAKGAHALTGLFLVAAGVAYLRQVDWVMGIVSWFGNNLW